MNRFVLNAVAGVALAGCCFGGLGGSAAPAIGLAPGFTPDPNIQTGRAGGLTQASTLQAGCVGNVGSTPNHVITASAAFPYLRIAANGGTNDITLVVRKADGTFLCNDDTDGFHPVVEGPFPAGEIQIYVGSYSSDDTLAAYKLGISELATTTPTSIGTP